MQTAFNSWRAGIGSGSFPFGVSISHSGDNPITPWVQTDSGTFDQHQLTAGSDLDKAATGPWPYILDAGLTVDYGSGWGWKGFPSSPFLNPYHQNHPGNYGSVSSTANWSFRGWAFPANEPGTEGSIGQLAPAGYPNPKRPMWNNLPSAPLVYGARVVNPNQLAGFNNLTNIENQNTYSLSFNQAGVASIAMPTGVIGSPVLL